tara:strand:- start:1664 stop:1891 length:228 start_codon:yes stop_codon:yes gene_type:complete
MLGLLVVKLLMFKKYRHCWLVCVQRRESQRVVIRSFVLKYDARQTLQRWKQHAPHVTAYIVDSRNSQAMKTLGLA